MNNLVKKVKFTFSLVLMSGVLAGCGVQNSGTNPIVPLETPNSSITLTPTSSLTANVLTPTVTSEVTLHSKTFDKCGVSFNYKSSDFTSFSEGNYRTYLRDQSIAEARVYLTAADGWNITKEVDVECGKTDLKTPKEFFEILEERWDLGEVGYAGKNIISVSENINGQNYLVADVTFDTEAMGRITERVYVTVNKGKAYIIRVADDVNKDYDTTLKNAGLKYL